MPPPRPPARLLALALCGALAAGCGEAAPRYDPTQPGLVRLVPRPPPVPGAPATPQLVAVLDVGEALERWRIESVDEPPRLLKNKKKGEGPPLLRLRGLKPKSLRLPLPEGIGPFNRVDVLVRLQRYAGIHADWYSQGLARGRASEALMASPDVQVVTLRLPYRTAAYQPAEELGLILGGAGHIDVGNVQLLREPWGERLPAPGAGAEVVRIGTESREAFGLSSRVPLEFELAVPARAAEIRFEYGCPPALRLPDARPWLSFALRDGDEIVYQKRLRLQHDQDPEPVWRAASAGLSGLAGRALVARFEIAGAPSDEAFCALTPPQVVTRSRGAPTVLLITSDTHRADHLNAARSSVELRTPALDALAARGVLYENCFSSTNVTNPSHVALLTGTHPRDTRIVDNATTLVRAAPTLAERFRDAGFQTFACVSADHLDDHLSGLGQGFDRMWAPKDPQCIAAPAVAQIEAWLPEAEGLPLFLWLHVFDAHTPYTPPPDFDRLYYPRDEDPFDPALADVLPGPLMPPWMPGLKDLEFPTAQYRAEVTYLDHVLERVLRHERLQDACVIFTADHGESFGQHGVYWDHAGLYPDTIHVPLILAWPDAPRGTRVADPVEHIDAGRTLLDLGGLAHVDFPGRNLLWPLSASLGEAQPRFAISAYGFEASIQRGPWQLIVHLKAHHYGPPSHAPYNPAHKTELYNLERDPGCLVDLAQEEIELARQLRSELVDWLGEARDLGWGRRAVGDAGLHEKLAALGYTARAGDLAGEHPWIAPDCRCELCTPFLRQ